MSAFTPMIQELEQEAMATRRMLERVPDEKLSWKPHEKSMSLGQLAHHLASTPGGVAEMALGDEVPVPEFGSLPEPDSTAHVLSTLDESLARAKEILSGFTDRDAGVRWRAVDDEGNEVMAMPRIQMLRAILLNHWYHHRGQMSVYLRLLDVPVPATYGDSADEHPLAEGG